MIERIKLDKIRLDGGTQPRKEIDEPLVQHYTEILLEGKDKFPPIDLWFDGKSYWPSDGFHRFHAHKRAGFKDIEASVNQGTKRDAFLACLRANGKHGKPRTPDERRYVVQMALEDIELGDKTDVEIAAICDVSSMTVGRVRKALGLEKAVRVDKKGRKVNVTNMGRKKEEAPPPVPEYTEADKMEEMAKEHTIIAEENTKLKDMLAVKTLPVSEEAKAEVQQVLVDLREDIKTLEYQLRAMTQSRNEFQSKNAEMIKQLTYWKRRAEKAEKALETK
tara:strand:+ start:2160 stop:2990 length:831 start_codon:yes stop_codon:yes gene_type:complete